MDMQTPASIRRSSMLPALAIGAIIGGLIVAALAGWAMFGTSILFTYAQDGLAWCF